MDDGQQAPLAYWAESGVSKPSLNSNNWRKSSLDGMFISHVNFSAAKENLSGILLSKILDGKDIIGILKTSYFEII